MASSQAGTIAPRRDLHNGQSLWQGVPLRPVKVLPAQRDESFEIVIVGGGISGAITALVLAACGHEVAVLDRRSPGEGSTIASTAMIQFELDSPLTELAAKIGSKLAARAYLRSARAVEDLGRLIETHNLDSDWLVRDALYLAGNEMGWRGLKSEARAREKLGLPSQFLSKPEVRERFGISTTGAILSSGSAELNPAKTAASCLRAAQKLGAKVFSPCEVFAVQTGPGSVNLATKAGALFTCRKAIFATGYEVIDGIPRNSFDIVSSWAIATKPIPPEAFWPTRCLIWEAADPYLYLRSTADNRILAGGEDSGLLDPKRRASAIPAKSAQLLRKVARLLNMPDLEIDYSWAGAFADSPTGLPVFKELPELPGVLAILGCGGNGITFSMIASDIVKAWVAGRTDPDAHLFAGR